MIQMHTDHQAFPTQGIFPTVGSADVAHFAQRQDCSWGQVQQGALPCTEQRNPSVPEATDRLITMPQISKQAILSCFYGK